MSRYTKEEIKNLEHIYLRFKDIYEDEAKIGIIINDTYLKLYEKVKKNVEE